MTIRQQNNENVTLSYKAYYSRHKQLKRSKYSWRSWRNWMASKSHSIDTGYRDHQIAEESSTFLTLISLPTYDCDRKTCVWQNDYPISGKMHICLNSMRTSFHCCAHSLEAVFRPCGLVASMAIACDRRRAGCLRLKGEQLSNQLMTGTLVNYFLYLFLDWHGKRNVSFGMSLSSEIFISDIFLRPWFGDMARRL